MPGTWNQGTSKIVVAPVDPLDLHDRGHAQHQLADLARHPLDRVVLGHVVDLVVDVVGRVRTTDGARPRGESLDSGRQVGASGKKRQNVR